MNYPQVVDWLYSQLANYQKQGSSAYKPGLGNISALLQALGNPHLNFKSIHIAGTNGKGSTAHMLAAMIIENGYKAGLYTSPHIKDFRERIKINGELVGEAFVVDFVNRHQLLFERLNPSFFEITTAMAFSAFAQNKCDWAIIETGLGGRLDATNVLSPEISVITNIGIDHTEFLGNTLGAIATEKAGIIKPHKPVVIGEVLAETKTVFDSKVKETHSQIFRAESGSFQLDVLGKFQEKNANLAWKTIQVLKEKGHFFDDLKSQVALTRVGKLTKFFGRMTCIQAHPTVMVDASHNSAGIQNLMAEIENMTYHQLHCIYGSASDKNYEQSMTFFPKNARYYFTSFDSSRAVNEKDLLKIGESLGLSCQAYDRPNLALDAAKIKANPDDLILVFGSFYILEKII
jgi:dihydrofolate synthase/folylpolyglutamate synthase